MPEQADYYAVLEVGPDADRATIERAYNRLARLYQPHPAKPPLHPGQMALLDEAFDTLDDAQRRAVYDRERAGTAVNPPRRYMGRVLGASMLALAAFTAVAAVIVYLTAFDDSGVIPVDHEVRILAPEMDAVVTSPVTLRVESTDITIAEREAGVEGAAHYHAFINVHPFTPIDHVIPHEPDIIHFTEETLTLDLEPGEHTIIVVLGDNDHVRLPNASVDFIDIVVVE